ncbi:hypothetical protein GCM10020229_54590 [Kitasatospora albolonga]|uniref:DUF4230 domain-containing protein n=1 Tax=Kitasatospora albolonga TaxID=68173 RepID=UPI00336FD4E7
MTPSGRIRAKSRTDEEPSPREGRRRGLPWYLSLPVTLAVIVALFLAGVQGGIFPSLPNPFERKTVDRSQPVLLQSIQQMKRFTGAQGNFQVIVDLDHEAAFLPSQILGNRTLYVAAGSVDAYVDLGGLGADSVAVSEDRRSVTVKVPHAQLAPPAVDVKRSYVYLQQRGFFDRIGDFFSGKPRQPAPGRAARRAEDRAGGQGDRADPAGRGQHPGDAGRPAAFHGLHQRDGHRGLTAR